MTRFLVTLFVFVSWSAVVFAQPYALEVLPSETERATDPRSRAELTYLTSDPADDVNLYFHERSWLADGSLILFNSNREAGGLMGYLTSTGELVRFHSDAGGFTSATAAGDGARIFAMRGDEVLELQLVIDTAASPSRVTVEERLVCALPHASGQTALSESADGKRLAVGLTGLSDRGDPAIFVIDVASGVFRVLLRVGDTPGYGGHVQWSRTDPYTLSFAGQFPRLQIVDIREGVPRSAYAQLKNELVTHESWWVNDQLLFSGGLHPEPTEDSHVKVLNPNTGQVRVIGVGAWWPNGEDEAVAKQNFWHASGSPDGRWVAADNWHGDITLIEADTTRAQVLTLGHRVYGGGAHPHVGWDRLGKQVIFTSHKRGDANVCVATIPEGWSR
jgi:hypothetical protein